MHDHRDILELAAAAIDFDLDRDERKRLNDAVETCPLCRRQVAAMRATATVLRRPLAIGTPGRVRDVVIGSALRRSRRTPSLRSALAASLSILVVLGGTAVVISTRGLGTVPAASPAASAPGPTAAAQQSSPTSSAPDASSAPPSASTVRPSPVQVNPLRSGDVAAMVTDERLVIRTKPSTGVDSAIFKPRVYPGQRVLILEGPIEASGYPWYRVRLGGIEGWAAGTGADGEPWLAPVRNGVIAFVRETGGGAREAIDTIGPDGRSGEALLFADPSLVLYEQLTWSPDGRQLAFVATPADSAGGSTEVFTIDANGSNLAQITRNDVDDDNPAWSPDGTRLAIRVDAVGATGPEDSTVVVVPVRGPGFTVLGPGANPVWSPDGQQIAMTVTDGRSSYVWVQAPDGGARRQVSDMPVNPEPPSWSPDGLQLVVSYAGISLAPAGLSRIDVAAGSVTPLIDDPTSWPTWSIAGTIAFSATGTGAPGLFVVDSDGTGLRQILANRGFAAIAAWSPDGRWMVLDDETGGSPVTIVDAGSGDVAEIGSAGGVTRSAAWQPLLP